jgi:AraC-like DNA-binding protein
MAIASRWQSPMPLSQGEYWTLIQDGFKLLVARLSHPPSLIELARLAGINDCKLKSGFRQVFGTTVFGYLHDCRMERSRQLLEAGEMTVTEAARAVGFVSRGRFAAAFKRRFGVNPSAYVAQNRQDKRFLKQGSSFIMDSLK